MIQTLASLLSAIYVPTMWLMMAVFFILAVLAFAMPESLRRVAKTFTQLGPNRVLGLLFMLVGTETFVRSGQAAMAPLVKVMGVLFFILGGVCLVIPVLAVILAEKWVAMPNRRYWVFGLCFLAISVFFYIAQSFPPAVVAQ